MSTMARKPRPLPPYFSGITLPKNPSSPILSNRSLRNLRSLSSCPAVGAISFSANSRARSRTALNSSDSSKSIVLPFDEDGGSRIDDRNLSSSILDPRFPQQLPGDHDFLNFRCAFVDPQSAHVSIKQFHNAANHYAHAAMNLYGLVDDSLPGLGRE